MISLARFILKGPGQAAMVAAAMAILGLIFMPAAWFSAAAIALAVLVQGTRAGARVMGLAMLGTAVLCWLLFGRPELALFFVLIIWLPVWLPAVVLRLTVSLAYSLLTITLFAVMACLVFYGMLSGHETAYADMINTVLAQLIEQYGITLDDAQFSEVAAITAKLLPGLFVSSLMLGSMLSLLLARWWQAVLYNPGGFGEEFQSLRLGKTSAAVALLITLVTMAQPTDFMIALVMIVFSLYLLQGTSLLHAIVNGRKLNTVWLFVVYALIFFVPHIVVLMVLAGMIDAYLDFRRRLVPGE